MRFSTTSQTKRDHSPRRNNIAYEKKETSDERFLVHENIVLVDGDSTEAAFAKAEEIGRGDEGGDDDLALYGAHRHRATHNMRNSEGIAVKGGCHAP